MGAKVIRSLICAKSEYDEATGSVDCIKISDKLNVVSFPEKMNFSIVTWLEAVTEEENDFRITLKDISGSVVAEKTDFKIRNLFAKKQDSVVLILNFKDVNFDSPSDEYIYEIEQCGHKLLTGDQFQRKKSQFRPEEQGVGIDNALRGVDGQV